MKKPLSPTTQRLDVDLRRLEWATALSEETLGAIRDTAEWVEFHSGEVVIENESVVAHVSFLVTGRMQVTLYDLLGKEIDNDIFVRGSVIGLFTVTLSDRSYLKVEATEPSTAIRLTLSDLLTLMAKHADFQLSMFRVAANVFKRYTLVDRSLPKPAVVAIIHHTKASRPLVARLAHRLRELDESPCIAGDDEQCKPEGDVPFKLLVGDGGVLVRHDILTDWTSNRRLLIDFRADHSVEAMARVVSYADIVLWCVRPGDTDAAINVLQRVEKSVPRWRDKIRIVWMLDNSAQVASHEPKLYELVAERNFKLSLDAPGDSLLRHGFERIVHHLRGIHIGLALGGGAARGMAHLGVLKALEQNGIYIDRLAGTSAGAMTGILYAAGLDPTDVMHYFKTDLQPTWLFRRLPGGAYWYLLYKYRRNQFDPMLRKYLGRTRIEQLIIPVSTISVDLVEGEFVVRDVGDATIGILESINLPPLSLPIVESGHAMVDGGLLNNIPADVLVAKGCNFVIASSVTATLEKEFKGIGSKGRPLGSRFLSTVQVIMRQTMVQGYKMNAVGVRPADFVIAPDVTAFDMAEFTRADEMAVVGETATDASIAKLRSMLSKLDSKLFKSS